MIPILGKRGADCPFPHSSPFCPLEAEHRKGWGEISQGWDAQRGFRAESLAFELFWMPWKLPAFQQHLAQSLEAPVRADGHVHITGRGLHALQRYALGTSRCLYGCGPHFGLSGAAELICFRFFPCYPSSGEGHLPVEGAAALLPPGDLICWAY